MTSKALARKIFTDALEASLPKNFISKYVHLDGSILSVGSDKYKLDTYKNIYVFGSGKAAYTMALEIEKLLKSKIKNGLIVAPHTDEKLKYIEVCEGSHPLPSQKSFDATAKLIDLMQKCDEDDLYIYLLSGGSSALIEFPALGIDLKDFQEATQVMLHNGLEIHEMNTIRKHISQIKGGNLARICKAQGVVLVLSDIIDNDLYSIGSAPLYADKSTFKEAKYILMYNNIFHRMPQSVQEHLEKGLNGFIDETPKSESENVKHYIVASNSLALDAAAKSAKLHGLSVEVVEEPMYGDVEEMIDIMLQVLENSQKQCIIFGGECTVQVRGDGQGGRNQHAVALMLEEMYHKDLDICFLSASTDGIDGNSDATGAVVDKEDYKKIDPKELKSFIKNFDSYNFFKKIKSLIVTGASGTNVIDIAIIIKGE
jgi:glycerate 2-kinase